MQGKSIQGFKGKQGNLPLAHLPRGNAKSKTGKVCNLSGGRGKYVRGTFEISTSLV